MWQAGLQAHVARRGMEQHMKQHSETSQGAREDASARVPQLRAALLTGRGPGAPAQEIAQHTRDRSLLGAVPAPIERALVTRQGDHWRAGEPITKRSARTGFRRSRRQAALAGAAAALLIRWLVPRLIRARASRPW